MRLWDYLKGLGRALVGRNQSARVSAHDRQEPDLYQRYGALDARYDNADYEELTELLKDTGEIPKGYEAVKSLRNPVPRVVEVYAANLLEEDLLEHLEQPEGSTASVEALKPLLKKVYDAAEWQEEARRAFPGHGELWHKAVGVPDPDAALRRVYPQIIDPRYVSDFDEDERGYLTYLRIDIPQERRKADGETEPYLYVEVWDKERATFKVYEGDEDATPGEDLDDLTLKNRMTLGTAPNGDGERFTGFDFIPVVHYRFKRVLGRKRGVPPFEHALANIDRLNELVTKLHSIMFPDVAVVITREGVGPDGTPLPPIELEGYEAQAALNEAERMGFKVIEVSGEKVLRLPAGSNLDYKIPPIDFASHLAIIQEEQSEIERLLVELAYYRMRELELSGYAIELSLRDLLDRIKAARKNFEKGLVRFDQMAISVGQAIGAEGFDSVGRFEDGALDHAFAERDIFVPPEKDEAETVESKGRALAQFKDLGLLEAGLKLLGFDDDDAARLARESEDALTARVPPLELFGGAVGQPPARQPQPPAGGGNPQGG